MTGDEVAVTEAPRPESQPRAGLAAPRERPRLVAIVGDSGSGKSTVAAAAAALLGRERITELHLDDYHRFTREERAARGLTALNPSVHNFPLMLEHLRLLRQGRPIRNRSYNHADGTFGPIRPIQPREVVIVRGLLGFPTDELQELYDLSVFLQPEPELLFRWKLRRDVQSRGYTEAEVLKYIAQHLLDSKEYVLPQADRADVVVRYCLPAADAPDEAVTASVLLRRRAAELGRGADLLAGLSAFAEESEGGSELRIQVGNRLTAGELEDWGQRIFPDTFGTGSVGSYIDEAGGRRIGPPLAAVELLVARLICLVRRSGGGEG